MTLPEAIRAGAKLRPQAHSLYFQHVGFVLHSCALGAAYEAVTGQIDITRPKLFALWPELSENFGLLHGQIIVLNDVEHQSREEIADFVERRAR